MSDPYHIPLGIEPLCDDPNKLLAHPFFDEMRAAINRGQRDSALIRNCVTQADYNGLNGEDRYVLLAYHTLVMLEQLHKREMVILKGLPLQSVTMPLSQLLNHCDQCHHPVECHTDVQTCTHYGCDCNRRFVKMPPVELRPSPFAEHLSMATKWEEGSPRAPGHYVMEYRNANFEALNLIAGSTLLKYPEAYNVKRHFRFYP